MIPVVTVSKYNRLLIRYTSIIIGHLYRSLHRHHCIIAFSRHIHTGVNLRTHPVRGELHIQRNANV